MSVTRPVVKTETLKKKNQTSLGISLPLESGQLERWYFHLGASNGISVKFVQNKLYVLVLSRSFVNKLYCACLTLSRIESTISNQVSDYLKVVFSSWKNLCSNMIITTSNPSYLKLLGLFTVHTNISTNARLSLQL